MRQWKATRLKWHLSSLGLGEWKITDFTIMISWRITPDAAADIEFNFPFGFKELEGIHSQEQISILKRTAGALW